MIALLIYRRLRVAGVRRVSGLIYTRRWLPEPRTIVIFSLWHSERSLIEFTTLDEHSFSVRWTKKVGGDVWSGVFRAKGTSSLSQGWIGAIEQWVPDIQTLRAGPESRREVQDD